MDQFAAARAKYEKNRTSQARPLPTVEVIEKKEAPKPEVRKVEPMVLKISGPVEMTLEVDYQGTLLSGQCNEQNLRAMFKKALLPIGKVR